MVIACLRSLNFFESSTLLMQVRLPMPKGFSLLHSVA